MKQTPLGRWTVTTPVKKKPSQLPQSIQCLPVAPPSLFINRPSQSPFSSPVVSGLRLLWAPLPNTLMRWQRSWPRSALPDCRCMSLGSWDALLHNAAPTRTVKVTFSRLCFLPQLPKVWDLMPTAPPLHPVSDFITGGTLCLLISLLDVIHFSVKLNDVPVVRCVSIRFLQN